MKTVYLYRHETGPEGTFGRLVMDKDELCKTLEDQWLDNTRKQSCIPVGRYLCVKHGWNNEPVRFRETWEITGVPNRTAILFHAGNSTDDTQGCVLVGHLFGMIDGKRGILGSRAAMNDLRKKLPDSFWLEVIW